MSTGERELKPTTKTFDWLTKTITINVFRKINKGYSLHIGLNSVDPNAEEYDGWEGKLSSAEEDALAMSQIAKSLNYVETKLLLGKEATRNAFFEAVQAIQHKLERGDLFLLTFAGHGGQDGEEKNDELDEIWCLYNAQVLDDEIHDLLKTFDEGIRILIVSDSCFSGDILREEGNNPIFRQGRNQYIKLEGVKASVILFASYQEFQEVHGRGILTSTLQEILENGNFEGDYQDLYEKIISEMPFEASRSANYLWGGVIDKAFYRSKPFMLPQ